MKQLSKNVGSIAYPALTAVFATIAAMPTAAFAAPTNGTMNGILQNIGGIAVVVVAIIGVVIVGKQAVDYFRGSGSIGKIAISVLVVLLIIGLIVVLMNVESLSSVFGNIADTAVDTTGDLASDVLA